MCRTDRASVAPVPYSYGVGLGALFVSCSYNMAALPNVCRLGYAVVSGAHVKHVVGAWKLMEQP